MKRIFQSRFLRQQFSTLQTPPQQIQTEFQAPSRVLCRLEEYYDAVLAEDLMILSYDHKYTNPESIHRKVIQEENERVNREFREYVQDKRAEERLVEMEGLRKKTKTATPIPSASTTKNTNHQDYLRYLDPLPPTTEEVDARPCAYDRIPRLKEITVRMMMPEAITHSKKVLMNGLLALQLITCQHGKIDLAQEGDARLKARKGMPIGVSVTLRDEGYMYSFLDKLVEIVLPRIRDFAGFSQHVGDGKGGVSLKFDAEAWQAFPEVETCYLKFPSAGSVGALPPFEVEFKSTLKDDDMTRLLLSGFKVPFTFRQEVVHREEQKKEENVHEV